MDCFSKYALFFPLRTATTSAIIRTLEDHVFLVYGAPEILVADNGPQFRSHAFKSLASSYQIKISFTPNYHPQANPVERIHRVIKTMLTAYVKENHRQWDRFLPKVASAIRSSRTEVTNLTPNFINFGREVRLSGKNTLLENSSPAPYNNPELMSNVLNRVSHDVQKRLSKAYHVSKKTYNLRRRNDRFNLHQQVWKRNYVLSDASKKFTAKLAPKFSGPHTITRILSPWTYELTDVTGRCIGTWHAKDLKSHPPDDLNNSSDEE